MVKPVLADLASKMMPGQAQNLETNRSVVDQTFEDVFNSLEKTTSGREDSRSKGHDENNGSSDEKINDHENLERHENRSSEEKSDESKNVEVKDAPVKTVENNHENKTDVVENPEKSETVNTNENIKAPEESLTEAEKEALVDAVEQIIEKVNELLAADPKALEELLAGIDTTTFRDLLTALGVDNAEIEGLSKIIDLDKKLPQEAMQALLTGKPAAFLQVLKNISPNNTLLNEIFAAVKQTAEMTKMTKAPEKVSVKMAESPKILNAPKIVDAPKTANTPKIVNAPKIVDAPKTADAPKIVNAPKIVDAPKIVNAPKENSARENGVNELVSSKDTPEVKGVVKKAAQPANSENQQNHQQAKPENHPNNQTLRQSHGDKAPPLTSQQAQARPEGVSKAKTQGPAMDVNLSGETLKKADIAQATAKKAGSASNAFERMLMTQIVNKARIHIRPSGQSNMILRLDPPSLGKIDVRIVTQENVMRAVMLVESREVKMAVESNIDSLKASLNNAGLKVDQISVDLHGQGFTLRNENLAKDFGSKSGSKQNGAAQNDAGEFGDNESISDKAAMKVHDGLLDVVA